jgi:hypothetical protein
MKQLRYSIPVLLISALFVLSIGLQSQALTLDVEAIVESKPISEMSGIVKSRARENLYWVHNDSGDDARIFAIDNEGKNVIPTYSKFSFYGEEKVKGKDQWQGFKVLFSENVDWEDMTIDENYIYISDMGNNANDREDLGIYIISEIDPTASTQSASIKHLPVRYPEQQSFPASVWNYDSESLFSADGSLYLITKHRVTGESFEWTAGANLYRLDSSFSDEDNVLTLIEGHDEITAATSAEVSPDGQTLAVLSLTALWLFDKPDTGDAWLSSSSRKITLEPDNVRQVEAVTWVDDETILITNEQRDMFHINLAL